MTSPYSELVIGVLAIQGAVSEHCSSVEHLGAKVKQMKMPVDFENIDGIILPGGESTTMAIIGEEYGIFPLLKSWVEEGKPIFGTCAGMILLSDYAIKQKNGGQSLVGGLNVHVCRNFFGSQIYSRQVEINGSISMNSNAANDSTSNETNIESETPLTSFPAVFIRAPAIISAGPEVDVLAKMTAKPHTSARDEVISLLHSTSSEIDDESVALEGDRKRTRTDSDDMVDIIVAVRQNNILATAFHPELTKDTRWHKLFLDMVKTTKVA